MDDEIRAAIARGRNFPTPVELVVSSHKGAHSRRESLRVKRHSSARSGGHISSVDRPRGARIRGQPPHHAPQANAQAADVLGVITGLLIYDLLQIRPHRAEIDAMLAATDPLERNPPPLLPRLQEINGGDWHAVQATRLILRDVDAGSHLRALQRARRELLWHLLLKFNYSYPELLQIERSKAFFGRDVTGYEAAAIRLFARPLNELNDLELAQLVVASGWPTRFMRPEFAERRESLARALLIRASSAESRKLNRS